MSEHSFLPYPTAYAYGRAMRFSGLSEETVVDFLRGSDIPNKDEEACRRGYQGHESRLHFIGVIPKQRWKALKIWGRPDFEHERATWSCLGEIAPEDTVVFGAGAFFMPKKWRAHTKLIAPHDIAA